MLERVNRKPILVSGVQITLQTNFEEKNNHYATIV